MSQSVLIAVIALGGPRVGFLGSIAGSIFFPWIRDRSERHRLERERIRDLMSEFQEVAQSVYLGRHSGFENIDQMLRMSTLDFKLVSLLRGTSRPMGRMISAVTSSARPDGSHDKAIYIEFTIEAKEWLSGAKSASKAFEDYTEKVEMHRLEGHEPPE